MNLAYPICTCVRVPHLVAGLLFKGGVYFVQELWIVWLLFEGGHYSRVASIRRNTVFAFHHYLEQYTMLNFIIVLCVVKAWVKLFHKYLCSISTDGSYTHQCFYNGLLIL